MGMEEDLYNELCDLRETLRADRRSSGGRPLTICTDEALRVMAQRVPTKAEDFAAIPGVGQRFVELYGDDFLVVTRRYAITAANGSNIDDEAAQTLRELEKKLININKANRLLFQPKLSKKFSFDVMSLPGVDIMGLIFGNKRSLKLVDTSKGGPDAAKAYKHLNEIMREVNREQRDKGQYDLYVAYPFVQGRMPDGDLDIRAPLALFPVILEKDTRTIVLKMDDSRDAIYNNTLILGFIKAGGQNKPLPDNIIEDYSGESFLSNLVDFYNANGITLDFGYSQPSPFVEYRAGEFPKYQPGEMHLTFNILIGKYPTYSSSIQRDFDSMLAGREINGILNDLIVDLNKGDFMSDYPLPLSEEAMAAKGLEASERDLFYINSLNSSQENIISAMEKGDEIVVQGPPGTGKSQVITGLITSAVVRGKTVLMVSEKKTALDVVYSRLGALSRYCLQIDDVADKESFYKQLARMLEAGVPGRRSDIEGVSESIDRDVNVLQNIADTMYRPGEFGIEPYKLYSMDRLDMTDKRQFDEYKILKENIEPSLLNLKYPDIQGLHRKFSDPTLMRNFDEYRGLVSRNPWMTQMKRDLTEFDIGEMKANLLDLERQADEWRSKGFIGKLFSKGKVTREATSMADRYFNSYSERTINALMDDPRGMFEALDGYETYTARATVYDRLTDDERNYGDDILGVSSQTKLPFQDSNDRIHQWILNDHLQRFDASHKDIMQEIWDFDSIISDMDRKISEKRIVCRDRVEEILQQDLRYITESKRRGDINRIIESKRKWNLNKFIGRYGYELFKGVRVWLLTPEVVSEILPLEMGIFDILIFDEASQMYVEKGVPSIYRAKKVVVAGDHKQLRPSSLGSGRIDYESDEDDPEDDVSAALEEESLLDLARSRYDSILLNFHYRSKYEELIAFSNYAFYGGRLYVSPNVEDPERPPIEVFRVDGLWEDKSNRAEAEKVVELLKEFFVNRRDNESVGIITFNSSQRDLISDVLDEACDADPSFGKAVNDEMRRFDNGEDVGLFIKNIESVQGDERDVIVFSVGYAKNSEGRLMQRFGWLNNRGGENRLNVAISRAKKKIMIVTSFDPSDLQVDNVKNEGPRILKKYLQYARAISDGNRELADSTLRSFGDERWAETDSVGSSRIADRVYNALTRKGYTVERDVGIGGYQIDLAVKQGNRYILGIECDSHLYSMESSTRERDYHRQKYLESRGWRIHRVWTPGMWKDPEREIAGIIDAIERSTSAMRP